MRAASKEDRQGLGLVPEPSSPREQAPSRVVRCTEPPKATGKDPVSLGIWRQMAAALSAFPQSARDVTTRVRGSFISLDFGRIGRSEAAMSDNRLLADKAWVEWRSYSAVWVLSGVGRRPGVQWWSAGSDQLQALARTEVRLCKTPQLVESLGVLRCHAKEASVTGCFPDVELGDSSRLSQCPVHSYIVREEPVARTGQKKRGRKTGEITEQR
jgi:hypothetical protein